MALNNRIPQGSKLISAGGIFKAFLGSPLPGKYDFTEYLSAAGDRYNVAVDFGLSMSPNYIYFFHQLNFSLSIDEGVFLSAIDSGTVPVFSFKDSQSRKPIFEQPFRLFRYYEGNAVDRFYHNQNANNILYGDFQCILNQVVDLQGIDVVYAQVSASVYEITDDAFIKQYKKENM